jgi:hypothetical protein
MTKMELALETLTAGGYWRKALETGYRGREMFETRLRTASGSVVKGVGYKTWLEMSKTEMLTSRSCARSSVWPEEWVLSAEK